MRASEITEILRRAGNPHDVAEFLRMAAATSRRRGGSRAALMLEELQVQADSIADVNVEAFLTGLFSVADEIDLEADKADAGDIGDNHLRIHWLLNNLVRDRFPQARRGQILESASASASLAWLVDISRRCTRDHLPEKQERDEQREPLVEKVVAARIEAMAINRIREASGNGTLVRNRRFVGLLFDWSELATVADVREWTDARLAEDPFIIFFAREAIQSSWITVMGDRVSRRHEYVDLEPFNEIFDIARLRERVTELLARTDLSHENRAILERFSEAPARIRR